MSFGINDDSKLLFKPEKSNKTKTSSLKSQSVKYNIMSKNNHD